jgi:hypothetical protein
LPLERISLYSKHFRGDTEAGAIESRGARDNLTPRWCAKNCQSVAKPYFVRVLSRAPSRFRSVIATKIPDSFA